MKRLAARMQRLRRGLVAVALVALGGLVGTQPACGGDPSALDGSVGEFYPLGFDGVRARLYSSELAIEWVSASGEAVVRVIVRRDEKDPSGPGTIDLAAVGDITGSSEGAEIPPFVSGTLHLDSYKRLHGARVEGTFEALMANGNVTITLTGIFETRLDVVEGL